MSKFINVIFFLVFITLATNSLAKNVTELVAKNTDLDERIVNACNNHCQGNRRQGRLIKVTTHREDDIYHRVEIWATFKNHHHQKTLVGGGIALYKYTVDVHAIGRLDQRDCKVKILDVKVYGDNLDIAGGAKKEIGKVYNAPNCQLFI